jgi:hypothetical protein
MISPLNPNHGLIAVSSIEERLVALNCTKISHGTKHTCKWRAPNGRHFHAPNPNVYSMVPEDTFPSVLTRLSLVMSLPSPLRIPGK